MILDSRLEFGNADDMYSNASTVLSENVIDTESARDFGQGQPLYLVIVVTTAFAGGTSVNFTLASDAAAGIATDGSASEHVSTGAIPTATAAAGFSLALVVPNEGQAYERYLGLLATTVGNMTAGAVDAFLTFEPSRWNAEPDSGIN